MQQTKTLEETVNELRLLRDRLNEATEQDERDLLTAYLWEALKGL